MTGSLFDDSADLPPDAGRPLARGVRAAEACAAAAAAGGWDRDGAARFILDYLAAHGPTAGEVLVTEASRAYPPHDARAFGAVFLALSRKGLIAKCGHAARAKGHGTAGGLVWRLADDGREAR